MKVKVINRRTIKTRNIGGDLAKQQFIIFKHENEEDEEVLMIIRRTLKKDNDILSTGDNIIKKFKDYVLIETIFSIKVSTMNQAIFLLNN